MSFDEIEKGAQYDERTGEETKILQIVPLYRSTDMICTLNIDGKITPGCRLPVFGMALVQSKHPDVGYSRYVMPITQAGELMVVAGLQAGESFDYLEAN